MPGHRRQSSPFDHSRPVGLLSWAAWLFSWTAWSGCLTVLLGRILWSNCLVQLLDRTAWSNLVAWLSCLIELWPSLQLLWDSQGCDFELLWDLSEGWSELSLESRGISWLFASQLYEVLDRQANHEPFMMKGFDLENAFIRTAVTSNR